MLIIIIFHLLFPLFLQTTTLKNSFRARTEIYFWGKNNLNKQKQKLEREPQRRTEGGCRGCFTQLATLREVDTLKSTLSLIKILVCYIKNSKKLLIPKKLDILAIFRACSSVLRMLK